MNRNGPFVTISVVACRGSTVVPARASTQNPHGLRTELAHQIFAETEAKFRVIAHDVGGGFGMKYFVYPEHPLVLWAARRLGRPVKWMSGRNEAFLSDTQGRDHVTKAGLALDGEARFLALKVETVANLGAYVSHLGPLSPSLLYTEMLAGAYVTPAIYAEVTGVLSNTIFTDAYRGAGRPEAAFVLERLSSTRSQGRLATQLHLRQQRRICR